MRLNAKSWNVNGLRAAARKGFDAWLESCGADVVLLQETKAREDQLPDEVRSPPGWHAAFAAAARPGYSGVAAYCRDAPDEVRVGLGVKKYDAEGRTIGVRFGSLWLVGAYFPNGGDDHSRVPYKLGFYRAMLRHANRLRDEGFDVVVSGDYNTAHRPIDLARPKQNVRTTGFLPEEREWVDRYVEAGWLDSFRLLHPDRAEAYSWWSFRSAARQRNVGWRLDYHFVSEGLAGRVREASIDAEVPGSDHCPVGLVVAAP
jgi:exodeoxyribonuclease-3